jgi:nicotinate (nicotinamide) nucleotide adenylyltransferase
MLEVAEKHYGSENEFWFLVGSDLFEHMHQWKDFVQDHQYGGFVVALRDNHTLSWLQMKQTSLQENGFNLNIVLIPNTHPHISSSTIRQAIADGNVPENTPEQVRIYITAHQLYQ